KKVVVSGIAALITHISADLLIAAALIREFRRMKSSFRHTQSRMNRVLNRLVVRALQTGSATATIEVATVIMLLIDDETNIPAGIMYCIGRFYMLSMLLNLNIRTSARPDSTEGISSGLQTPGEPTSVAFAHGGTETLSSIHFRRTALVQIDNRRDHALSGAFKSGIHLDNGNQRDMPELTFKSASGDDSFPEEIEMMSRKQSELVVA
ncbi:hypothetical protein B0H14DRAFT_1461819, partial [Mycena olivaceomarginata]